MNLKVLILLLLSSQIFGEIINLTLTNHVVLRGVINEQSVSKFLLNLQNLNENNIYIYISSPGGSVLDGLQIVDQIQQLTKSGVQVNCIADMAMSMAFVILQSCPNRLVTSASVLMQHQMSFGISGPIENVSSRMKFVKSLEEELTEMQSQRLNMTAKTFSDMIAHDWWLFGKEIFEYNVADSVIHVKCDKELSENVIVETIYSMFGDIQEIYSACPLSRTPIKVIGNQSTNQTTFSETSKKIDFKLTY